MVSISKVVGLASCSFLLCFGLSNAAQAANAASAADEMKSGQTSSDPMKGDQAKGSQSEGGKTIKGEVLRVEGDNYFVKGQDGKEVRLHIDQTTQKTGNVQQGDRIEAKVNDQNHALSIRSAQGTDAGHGNEPGRATESTPEAGKSGSSMGR